MLPTGLGRLPVVLHLDDVLVPDLRHRARFIEEAEQHLFVGAELGVDDLEGDALADDRVARHVHRAHGSLPDLLQDLIVADRRADLDHGRMIAASRGLRRKARAA
jgi:hypothetical protein